MADGVTTSPGMIGSSYTGGFSAGAYQSKGLLSQVGSWLGQNPALTMGVGAMLPTALGRTSTGTAPTAKIELTPRGKQLETSLYKSLKENKLFPENLATRFIGQAKKIEQLRSRASRRLFSRAASEDVVSGGVAKAMLTEGASRMRGAQEGYRKAGEARRGFTLNRLSQLQNFMNLQTQTPVLQAEADLINRELAQARGATQGAALGSIAQLLALSHVYR